MKKIVLLASIVLILSGCRPSSEEIGRQVTTLLQQKLDQQPELSRYHLTVTRVDVIYEDGNKYRGVANIQMNGRDHSVILSILDDGNQVMYETEPGAFLFVEQQAMHNAMIGHGDTGDRELQQSPQRKRNPKLAQAQPGEVVGEFDSTSH